MSAKQPATEKQADSNPYEGLGGRELVDRICGGDVEALLHLVVDRCGGFVRATAAEFRFDGDLSQEVCVHLFGKRGDWGKLRSWNGSAPLESWLMTVIKNVCVTEIRNSVKHRSRMQRLPDNTEGLNLARSWSDLMELEQEESISRILKAVEKLKERDRLIIHHRCIEEPPMSQDDLAKLLGIEPGALRVAEMRAKRRLAELLENERKGEDHV